MLAAVEAWVKRDHDAEWKRWTGWLEHIAAKVKTVDGVTTEIAQPVGLSNKTPSLRVRWDRAKLGVDGADGRPHAVQRRAAHHHDRRGRRRGRRSIGDGRHRRLDHART